MADSRKMIFEFIAVDRVSKTMKSIGDGTSKLSGKFASVGKTAAVGVAGAAVGGVALLSKMMIQGVKDAASYQTLLNKTAAVIKSTGGAAGVTVDHVKNLAGALESLSGVDEELIINSQNVLQTFTRIKNTKTQDTFDQATKAALNMSSALGTDLQGATIQVGKALNDPIKGITALSRVGVSFTQKQKDMIKKLEESGHHEKAQAIILKELNKEFGGAAKAAGKGFAGAMARAQDAVADAFRAVGTKLLPVLARLADWFATKGWPAMVKFAVALKARLEPAIRAVAKWVSQNFLPAVRAIWQWIATKLIPVLAKFGGAILKKIIEGAHKVSSAIKDNKAHYQGLFTVIAKVATFLVQKLGPVVTFLAKVFFTVLGKALVAIIRIIGTLLGWIGKLYRGVVTAGKFVVGATKTMVRAWNSFRNAIKIGALTVISIFANLVSKIISGAAKAFGWVPKIGPKLRAAAAAVKKWKDDVNRELARIKGPKNINFPVTAHGVIFGPGNKKLGAAATGGPIKSQGPGSSRMHDSVMYALRVDEHVWTPEEVAAVGGHKKMLALRQMARKGLLKTAAGGGPVTGWAPTNKLQSMPSFHAKVNRPISHGMEKMQLMLLKYLAGIWKKFASGGGVVAAARSQIGLPYSWGGGGKGGPSRGIGRGANTVGFDCSGLTQYAWWRGRHIDIGGTTYAQHPASRRISGPRPGALGFPHMGHVVIASDKPGYIIQAPFTGSHVQEVRRSMSDWRWPNRAAAGGPVVQLGGHAVAGWASNADVARAKLAMIAGDRLERRGTGGPVRTGMSYLVGEYGPEIYTPRRSGTVHPTGSTVINVHGPLVQVSGHVVGDLDEVKLTREIWGAARRAKNRGVNVKL